MSYYSFFPHIFDFVGDYEELTKLRSVCREFKSSICNHHVTHLIMKPDHHTESTLRAVSKTLVHLECVNMGLTSLPDLPKVKQLLCSRNRLQELPALPKAQVIDCSNNQLGNISTVLPVVRIFSCAGNPMTTFPKLPADCLLIDDPTDIFDDDEYTHLLDYDPIVPE